MCAITYFDEHAEQYAGWTRGSRGFKERAELFGSYMREFAGTPGSSSLCLDIGCGNGGLSVLAAASGYQVVGIDGSREMLRLASEQAPASYARTLEFRHAAVPLPREIMTAFRGRVDLIVASSVAEYLDDDEVFVAQCAELLKPPGRALISFANHRSIYWRLEQTLRERLPRRHSVTTIQKKQRTVESLENLAHRCALSVQDIRYFALPFQEQLGLFVKRRPTWLSTLFLAVFAPANLSGFPSG